MKFSCLHPMKLCFAYIVRNFVLVIPTDVVFQRDENNANFYTSLLEAVCLKTCPLINDRRLGSFTKAFDLILIKPHTLAKINTNKNMNLRVIDSYLELLKLDIWRQNWARFWWDLIVSSGLPSFIKVLIFFPPLWRLIWKSWNQLLPKTIWVHRW